MSTVMIKSQVSSKELLDGVSQLDDAVLDEFVSEVLALQTQRRADTFAAQEVELIEQINLGLSGKVWARYDVLQQKRRMATLTPEEHQELIAISNELEALNVKRVAALVQLATLRHTTLDALMNSLGIASPDYV